MFGENLRKLSANHGSISALSRQLGVNRTQFNRYLTGESFPRPDVLARICDFFGVDARILLDPVERITSTDGPINAPFLREFIGTTVQTVPESDFPTGFYQFSRRSFVRQEAFAQGIVFVSRDGESTFVRGYEPRQAMAMQGIPPAPGAREYRGYVLRVEDGLAIMVARRKGVTASLNYLSRVSSFENNYWVGYVARTMRENPSEVRVTRLVYEHLRNGLPTALRRARRAGFCSREELIPFHRRLLQPEEPFG